MTFSEFSLHSDIYKAITACGYTTPTPIQVEAIPAILAGHDLAGSAQTGTGKTAAFILPILHRLATGAPGKKPRILILTPTRELAAQITKATSIYGKFMRLNLVSLVGGMPYHQQIRGLSRGVDMIVATPGRLLDHLEQKRIDLSQIEVLVLDEADRMLDMGFIDDVRTIAKRLPANRQTLLFSATLDNKIMSQVQQLMKKPVRIDLSNKKMTVPQIKQEMFKVNNAQHKSRLLKHFLNDENIFKAIIFSATKINADKLATQLRHDGFSAAALHGDLRQNVRNRTLDQLRQGKIQYLVATDVAARGIDVQDVTHVINYDLPRFCEDYVHRIGRTGRAGKIGTAISFVLPTDTRHLQRIERYIGERLKINHANDHFPGQFNETADTTEKEKPRIHIRRSSHQEDSGYRKEKPSTRYTHRDGAHRDGAHRDGARRDGDSGYRREDSAPRRGRDRDSTYHREDSAPRRRGGDSGYRKEKPSTHRYTHRDGARRDGDSSYHRGDSTPHRQDDDSTNRREDSAPRHEDSARKEKKYSFRRDSNQNNQHKYSGKKHHRFDRPFRSRKTRTGEDSASS